MKFHAIFAAAFLAGCSSTPYSVIDVTHSQVSDPDNYDARILSIDGKMATYRGREKIDPGFHYINLQTTKPLKSKVSDYHLYALDAKPCTRYLLTAQHDNSVTDNWEVRLLREEKIEACDVGETHSEQQAPLPDYLTSHEAIQCLNSEQLTNSQTPVTLYPSLQRCIAEEKNEQAVYLYFLASAYGYYDAQRVADSSSHAAIPAIQKHSIWKLPEAIQVQFEQQLGTFIATPERFAEACQFVRDIGKPDYHPTYMIEHGVMKLQKGNGLDAGFDDDASWENVIQSQLRCQL